MDAKTPALRCRITSPLEGCPDKALREILELHLSPSNLGLKALKMLDHSP